MKTLRLVYAATLAVLIAGCAVEKSSTPLSPTVAGPIAGVQITAPKPLEPGYGARIAGDRQPLTLLIENASSNSVRPLSYVFEIASEPTFTNRIYAQENVPAGEVGRTSLVLPTNLTMGRTYYWRARALDGANEGAFSNPMEFNVYTPVAFDKPTLVSPINNEKVSSQRPAFTFNNAPREGNPTSVSYVIEISGDSAFTTKVAVWQLEETPAKTSFPSAADLPGGVQLFWRTRAFESPVIGPWSDTHAFRTPAPVVAAPSPVPVPTGNCSNTSQPFNVVTCVRSQFPAHMSPDQLVVFEKAVAANLNKSSVGGGPYGILRKKSGASCGGYSCDIICAGQGSGQQQWDILSDSDGAQSPTWNGPHTSPDIRVDQCDIQ